MKSRSKSSEEIGFSLPLVNAHTHAAMVAFRGMAEDVPLDVWLEKHIWPAEKARVTPKFVYEQTKRAICEMQKNGIQVFNDMYFFEEEVARAAEELGMRAVIGEVILDFPTPSAKTPEEAFKRTESLLNRYKGNPLIFAAVAPHSIYTVCQENLIRAKELAGKYSALYHIHLAETKREFDECKKKHGVTPVGYLDKLGVLDEKAVLAHCVWVTDEDIETLARAKAKVVHCPLSNLKLGSGIAPVAKMVEEGVIVALGTDGPASSNRLDIWEAGKIAALLQKGVSRDPTKMPAKEAAKMMTVNGLDALDIKGFGELSRSNVVEELDKAGNFDLLYEKNISDLEFV